MSELDSLLRRLEKKCPLMIAVLRETLTKSPAIECEVAKLLQHDESSFDEKEWSYGEKTVQEILEFSGGSVQDLGEALRAFIEVQYGACEMDFGEVVKQVYERDYYPLAEHLHYAFPYMMKRKQTIVDLAKQVGSNEIRFLDIGTGPAVIFGEILSNKSKWVGLGVDVSRQCLDHASSVITHMGITNRAGFVQADARQLPFGKDSFDLVVASEVLEHVSNPAVVLQEMRRVLRRGGYAIIGVPLNLSMVMHLSVFAEQQIVVNMIKEAGFEINIVETYPIFDDVTDISVLCWKT